MKRYPMAKPHITAKEEKYVLEVLRSGILSMGEKIEAFESAFARYIGARYAVAVSSGTAGLHLALLAAGIGKGDWVITSPFSFVASANAILYVGAKPVFADIDPVTYNIDPREIEKKITKQTKAILPVHIFGQAADMDPIRKIAKKYKLKIIEDACESIGATYKGRKAGTFGASGVFAFYPNKQMTTGEGGMVVTNDAKTRALVRSLRNQGRAENMQWLDHVRLGYNYRMNEMSAAVGLAQTERLPHLLAARARIADWYTASFAPYAEMVETPRVKDDNVHTWQVYVVRLVFRTKDRFGKRRDRVIEALKKHGIASKPYLPSIHLFGFYRERFGYARGDFPVSEAASDHTLALPFYIGLSREDTRYIARRLAACIKEVS